MDVGSRIGHYEIVAKLGQGGMGEVWQATDTQLSRQVAIKVLPPSLIGDAERSARFAREARLLAALNHPHIAAIYGLQQSGDAQALVLELVAGETLAERIERGPLPVTTALHVALQIAEAMECAHERGIVHRDLKPANVKVHESRDGQLLVKVLDFGLAVALANDADAAASSSGMEMSPTLSLAATRAGVVLGTAAYMSPEQAKGKSVDRRADIWAFGVVLAEMLTGRRLFSGETPSELMAAVMMREPDLSGLPAGTPASVRRLLDRCLRKEPRMRLRDIGEARIALQEALASDAGEAAVALAPVAAHASRLLLGGVAGGALLVGAVGAWMLRPEPPPLPYRQFELPGPAATAGAPAGAALSPAGGRLVYVESGNLWLHDLNARRPRLLVEGADAIEPFWSPDGRWVYYGSGSRILRVASGGGDPETVGRGPSDWSTAAGGAVMADGSVVFTTGNTGLLRIPAGGGEAESVLEPVEGEVDFHDVTALPGGRGVVFSVHRQDGRSIDAFDGTARHTLVQPGGDDPTYAPTGHLLYGRQGGVWGVDFSADTLQVSGAPFRVLAEGNDASVAADGTLLYHEVGRERLQWTWYDAGGRRLATPGDPFPRGENRGFALRLSPTADRVAYSLAESAGESDLWIAETDTGKATRITFERGDESASDWSPDGQRIAYVHVEPSADPDAPGPPVVRLVAADGGDARTLGPGTSPMFTPDGETLLYLSGERVMSLRLGLATGSPQPAPLNIDATDAFALTVSPDGRTLALARRLREPGSGVRLELMPFPAATPAVVAMEDDAPWRAFRHVWLPAGDGIVFTGRGGLGMHRIDTSTRGEIVVGPPRRLMFDVPGSFDVDAEGRYFAAAPATEANTGYGLTVVQNWFAPFMNPR